jgi:hypothetical protein
MDGPSLLFKKKEGNSSALMDGWAFSFVQKNEGNSSALMGLLFPFTKKRDEFSH